MDEDRAEGDYRMARANLLRVSSLKEYELVRAPFDGVVTARYVDPGALVPAATSATMSAEPVVDVADISRVRVFVYVGQDAAPFIHAGDAVTLWQDETPERRLTASVTRLASALDPRTRRMLCEVDMDNHDGALMPGTFVHAKLSLSVPPSPVVPSEALTVRNGKDLVAEVDEQRRVHFVPVVPGFTDGREVRILDGLKGGETVVQVVPADLEDGELIDAAPAKKRESANQKAAKPAEATSAQTPGAVPSDKPPNFGDARFAPTASSAPKPPPH
jgi:RND family efflux transporter MFP subunit